MNSEPAMPTLAAPQPVRAIRHLTNRKFGDRAFKWFTLLMALSIFVLVILIAWKLAAGSSLSVHKFGWRFLVTSEWDPAHDRFGALPLIFGTVVSSLLAIVIAVPLSVATAVFITELAPGWSGQPLTIFIELLAAIPSVILGFWGLKVMVPWLRGHLVPVLRNTFGYLPCFKGDMYGPSMLAAGIILAIMIIPIITSVSREILLSVPGLQREAAYALGATRWEVTRMAVLSYAKKGFFGAVILGLGRALGETMAVTMVIGNSPEITSSLFSPGYTLASVVANEFNESGSDMIYTSALFELGLVLLGITLLVNVLAQVLLTRSPVPPSNPNA